jgi:hypothetical protein
MKKFKENKIVDLSQINGGSAVLKKTIIHTWNWDVFFDGSLFRGEGINEYDQVVLIPDSLKLAKNN